MSQSLFDQSSDRSPLASRMRPRTIEEFVGQSHALKQGTPVQRLLDPQWKGSHTSVILWGPPGTGKTTLAQLIARSSSSAFVELSAVSAGIKDVRDAIGAARERRDTYGQTTVLFIDEVHRFNKTQQDALLPGVENGWVTLIAATTENPAFSVLSPLLSRAVLVTLSSLDDVDIATLINRCLTDRRAFQNDILLAPQVPEVLVRLAGGDARRALTTLEAAVAVATHQKSDVVTHEHVTMAVDTFVVRYDPDGDQHYDIISAYIKSIRGSDVDAALHYLARMVEAGEDPRFIARRLIILASEDIGLADNSMLNLSVSTAQAVALIGMPEGRIPLAQATIALALAPKSNSAVSAISQAVSDVKSGLVGQVPVHLRDSHYARAASLGHGVDYQYPHDEASGVSPQQYAPDPVLERHYYSPTDHGHERVLREILQRIKALLGRT